MDKQRDHNIDYLINQVNSAVKASIQILPEESQAGVELILGYSVKALRDSEEDCDYGGMIDSIMGVGEIVSTLPHYLTSHFRGKERLTIEKQKDIEGEFGRLIEIMQEEVVEVLGKRCGCRGK